MNNGGFQIVPVVIVGFYHLVEVKYGVLTDGSITLQRETFGYIHARCQLHTDAVAAFDIGAQFFTDIT